MSRCSGKVSHSSLSRVCQKPTFELACKRLIFRIADQRIALYQNHMFVARSKGRSGRGKSTGESTDGRSVALVLGTAKVGDVKNLRST